MFFSFEPRPSRFRLGHFCKCGRSPIRKRSRVGLGRLPNGFPPLLIKLLRCTGCSGFHKAGHLIRRIFFRTVLRKRSAALRVVLCSDKSILHALGSHGGLVYSRCAGSHFQKTKILNGKAYIFLYRRTPFFSSSIEKTKQTITYVINLSRCSVNQFVFDQP